MKVTFFVFIRYIDVSNEEQHIKIAKKFIERGYKNGHLTIVVM